MSNYEILIVGQGLAGINLSYQLRKAGVSVFHIHHSLAGESTKVAAGLINPITGRRFVKSWNIDQVMPFAEARYKEFEQLLGGVYLRKLNIVRAFHQAEDENTWLAKSADPYLAQFLLEKSEWLIDKSHGIQDRMNIADLIGELQNCFKIELHQLQKDYLIYLRQNELLLEEEFDDTVLVVEDNSYVYKGRRFSKVIFAEGWKVIHNRFFPEEAFSPAKGELLVIHAPLLKLNKAYKKSMFITPLGNDNYWVGATYEWGNFDVSQTEKMKTRILQALDEMIDVPYTIVKHLTGMRPSSKDRRPILGVSQQEEGVYIFNGMGTKGSSLAPFYSKVLAENIIAGTAIPHEVCISRYR